MIKDRNIDNAAAIQEHKLNIGGNVGVKKLYVGTDGTQAYELAKTRVPDADLYTTLDAAVAGTVANRGDIIYVLQNHAENLAADSAVDLDVAGINVVGLGRGEDRPTFTFITATTADFKIAAANVSVHNLLMKCNIDQLAMMIEVSGDDAEISHCEFKEGSSKEALTFITIGVADADSDRCHIHHCKFYAPTAGDGDAAISFATDHTGVTIEHCDAYGDWDLACIDIPVGGNAQVDLIIRDCYLVNLLTGQHAIQINGTGSTGTIQRINCVTDALATSIDAGGCEMFDCYHNLGTDQGGWTPIVAPADTASNILGADNNNNAFASTNVAANKDGSIIERLEQIMEAVNPDSGTSLAATESLADILYATNGIAAYPSAAAPANGVSLAEVLRDIWDALRNGTGGAEPATNKSLMDYQGVSPDFYSPQLGYTVTKTCDLGAANDDLFTVTGKVLITLIVGEVTTTLTGAEAFQLRIKTDNIALCAATTIDTDADGTQYILTGDFGDTMNGGGAMVLRAADCNSLGASRHFVVGDAGGTATIESNTTGNNGNILFTLCYIPLEASATVVAAA